MTRWTSLVAAGGANTLTDAAARPGVRASSAGPDLEGSFGGLGLSWDLTSDRTPADVLTASTAGPPAPAVDAVALLPVACRRVLFDGPRVKRTLLLTVRPGTPAEVVARFEADLAAMPEHITTIRSWALSKVDQTVSPSSWTHAWEQEYADVEGLNGAYLRHPYHWTHVDRWFDPEMPDSIVAPKLAHVFRRAQGPVL
ncbi:Dabb family protein [Streptomyces sp. NPDC050658]|uniref:Dabb family protein n=1 Tax=unclassified Streptomyces TaxID=2593676 RepID=UPI0034394B0E